MNDLEKECDYYRQASMFGLVKLAAAISLIETHVGHYDKKKKKMIRGKSDPLFETRMRDYKKHLNAGRESYKLAADMRDKRLG